MAWLHIWASLHVLFPLNMHAAISAEMYAECSFEGRMSFLDLWREPAALYTIQRATKVQQKGNIRPVTYKWEAGINNMDVVC